MKNVPIIIERIYNSSISKVWNAITDKDEMKVWYFDLKEFKPEVGFKFQFTGGPDDGKQYLHLCEITEVIDKEKLTYSWKYDGYTGISYVTFELFEREEKTLLRLTHKGLDSLPKDNPDFDKNNFNEGWSSFLYKSLKDYLEPDHFQHEISVNASLEKIFESVTNEITLWWTEMFEGSSNKLGDTFTVRFGPSVFKTMLIKELIHNKQVSWLVIDTLIDIPELKNKSEWLNTIITWEFREENKRTVISITHFGLNPNIECYDICSFGWIQFCDSLKLHLEKGRGMPFKQVNSN